MYRDAASCKKVQYHAYLLLLLQISRIGEIWHKDILHAKRQRKQSKKVFMLLMTALKAPFTKCDCSLQLCKHISFAALPPLPLCVKSSQRPSK